MTTKTVLFAAIVLSLVTSVAGLGLVEAKTSDKTIPSDMLLEKDDSWIQKYSSAEEFYKVDGAIRAYVSDEHPDNKWNADTKANEIRIYNFDVLAGQKNSGLHALLADAQDQKTSGTYDPTDAERKFHEWASSRIDTPVKPNADPALVTEVIRAYNDNVNLGHVPFELIKQNNTFWAQVMHDSLCENYIECDPEATAPNDSGPDCSIVPCAEAYHQSPYHVLEVSVEPYSCYEGTGCFFSGIDAGTGTLGVSLSSADGEKHSNTSKLEYRISMADYSSEKAYLVATGDLRVGNPTESINPVAGFDLVVFEDTESVDDVTCGSDHCGTYGITAESNAYILH